MLGIIIPVSIIAVIVVLIIIKLVRDKKKGKCSGCPYSRNCNNDCTNKKL